VARLAHHRAVEAGAQALEEGGRQLAVEGERGRQLHQQRTQPVAESADLVEERGQRRRGLGRGLQAGLVRERARHLHGEAEAARRRGRPALVGGALVRAVERGVDLHRA